MSGAEFVAVLSIGASVIQVAAACSKISQRIQEFRQNIAFQDLALQLPLLVEDVKALDSPEYRELLDPPSEQAMIRVLEGCRRQLDTLDKLIQTMTPAEDASKLRRAWKGVRSFGKDTKLREIMGILENYKSTITLHVSSRCRQIRRSNGPHNTTKTFFEVPAKRVSNYVGRTQVLEQINSAIKASTVNPSVVVLTGAGGQGKTQLALEYCRVSIILYKAIFWIDASSEASTIRSFESIAAKICNLDESFLDNRARIESVKERLRTWPERWLLVFDNYDHPHAFKNLTSFFPISSGPVQNVILVTSRHLSCERLGTCIKVDGLTEDEALELLQSKSSRVQSSDEELEEGKKIVERLGYLALAIDQAAAYISIRQLPLSLFTEHYEKRKEFVLRDTPTSLWEYRARTDSRGPEQNLSVLTTWELSFEQISENDTERESIGHFLTQSAFFDPRNIGESLFSNYLQRCDDTNVKPEAWMSTFLVEGRWDSFRFQDVVVGLMNLSLIQSIEFTGQEVKFSLHPLVKDWLQLRRSDYVQSTSYVSTAILMTASVIENQDIENLNLQTRQELLGNIDACVENTRSHLTTEESKTYHGGYLEGFQTEFATIYGQHDRHTDAETIFTEALALQSNVLGQFDDATLRTMNNLGALYLDMKQADKAEYTLQQALHRREKVRGVNHTLTLNTANNMGNLYVMLSMYDKATEVFQRTLEGRIKAHGLQHKTVVEAYNNLGEVSMKKGDLNDAEQKFETALEIAQSIFVGENALVLYLMSNIAIVCKLQRRYSEAVELYRQVIKGRETLLGPNHSATLTSMCELGDVYQATGQPDKAERWYVRGKASPQRRQRELLQIQSQNEGVKSPGMLCPQAKDPITQRAGIAQSQYRQLEQEEGWSFREHVPRVQKRIPTRESSPNQKFSQHLDSNRITVDGHPEGSLPVIPTGLGEISKKLPAIPSEVRTEGAGLAVDRHGLTIQQICPSAISRGNLKNNSYEQHPGYVYGNESTRIDDTATPRVNPYMEESKADRERDVDPAFLSVQPSLGFFDDYTGLGEYPHDRFGIQRHRAAPAPYIYSTGQEKHIDRWTPLPLSLPPGYPAGQGSNIDGFGIQSRQRMSYIPSMGQEKNIDRFGNPSRNSMSTISSTGQEKSIDRFGIPSRQAASMSYVPSMGQEKNIDRFGIPSRQAASMSTIPSMGQEQNTDRFGAQSHAAPYIYSTVEERHIDRWAAPRPLPVPLPPDYSAGQGRNIDRFGIQSQQPASYSGYEE